MGERWAIRDILDRVDLAALLDEVAIAGPGQGRNRRWHCPLTDHPDAHPSVTVHRDHHGHERWRCWSGDSSHRGDAVDLLVAVHHLDRAVAIEQLATRAGLTIGQPLPPAPHRPTGPPPATEVSEQVTAYVEVCRSLLWGPLGRDVLDYLHGRGFSDDTLAANHVGADPGRAKLQRTRGLPYGHGAGATFPAFDLTGNVTYVQTRALHPDGRHKYDNPASHLAPHPRITWPHPSGTILDEQLIVCEGMPDTLTAAQAGYRTVGLLGTNMVDDTVAAVIANVARGEHRSITIVPHPDKAGRAAATDLAERLAAARTPSGIVELSAGHDLNQHLVNRCTVALEAIDPPSVGRHSLSPADG